jgi:hypothetical protein
VRRAASGEGVRIWRFSTGLGAAGWVFPGLFLIATLMLDVVLPMWIAPPLVVALPILALATAGIVGAAVFTALGALLTFLTVLGSWPQSRHVFFAELVALVVVFGASVLPGYLRSRREQAIQRLRSVVEEVQRVMLPPIVNQDGVVRASAEYLAADEEARIGGDLYDVVDTVFGVRMIIGDVRGKGLSAVAAANNLLGAFREGAHYAPTLATLAERLDDSVHRHQARTGKDAEEFITAALVSVPPRSCAEVLSCGHPGPLLIRAGSVRPVELADPSPPLGVGRIRAEDCRPEAIPFDVGDRLLLYTDGIVEARDVSGDFYPLPERVELWKGAKPDKLIEYLVEDLARHTDGRRSDDAAVLTSERIAISPYHPRFRGEDAAGSRGAEARRTDIPS